MQMNKRGYALIMVLAFIGVFFAMCIGVIGFANNEIGLSKQQIDSVKAFFLAESGIERAIASVRDSGGIGSVPASFNLAGVATADDADLDNTNVSIASSAIGGNMYQITATATVENSTRQITANLLYNPPSQVFDYSYFLNNWGWFYAPNITSNGDVRSNGRFDFRFNPTVEGDVYAGQEIGGSDLVRGSAGDQEDGEYINQHPNSPTVEMPNLQDLSYYEFLATDNSSTITVGGAILVEGVFGDDVGESGNIVLIGTAANPVEVDGPVVIRGDVIVQGVVTGQGTIYAGRNMYIAGNITYADGPPTPRPDSNEPDDIDQWVSDNAEKDIVGFAATENMILGDYTKLSNPYNWGWLTSTYLFSMGGEDVGEDGIPDTGDTGEGDGVFQESDEDLDGDEVFDDDYNWTDIQTQTDITNFSNLPAGVDSFDDVAAQKITEINGVLYTNHAIAGFGFGVDVNGAIISKDEVVAIYNSITMNFDERLHSRYRSDPNWLIDLALPVFNGVTVEGWWES